MKKIKSPSETHELIVGVRVLLKTLTVFQDRLQKLLSLGVLEIFPQRHWLSRAQACDFLCCCKNTLASYRDKGLLHASKIGSKCYYLESDLIAFIESGRSGNKAPLTFSTDH